MNYMEKVAEMLGVELYENFRYESTKTGLSEYKFRITEKYFEYYNTKFNVWIVATSITVCNLLNGEYKVVKFPILDDAEKEYLSTVIKPFRNKIKYLRKNRYGFGTYIFISLYGNKPAAIISIHDPEIYYTGMKIGKFYSLEELGL